MMNDTVMMTYAEAGRKLGIKADSVRRRARNRNWNRIKGNDGLTLVGIPREIIPMDVPQDISPDRPADISDTVLIVENTALRTELRILKEFYLQRMDDLSADRDAWRQQAQKRRSWWPF